MDNFKTRLSRVTTIMLDMDGVLSVPNVWLMDGQDPVRTLHTKDGYALRLAVMKGLKVLVISGGKSEAVRASMKRLGVEDVFMRVPDKLACYKDFINEHGIEEETILYMGDDLPDYEVMQRVGVPVCPKDAAPEIKGICIHVTAAKGGQGCVREIVEQVLRVQGKWEIVHW